MDYFYRTAVSGTQRASNSAAWTTLINHDWSHNSPPPNPYPVGINQHANCQASPVGMFRGYKDFDGKYICNSKQTATIGGTPRTGDVLSIKITDAALPLVGSPDIPANHYVTVSYTVPAGASLTSIATGLKNAINNNATLSSHNISATSSGAVITITVGTGNATTYTKTITPAGATETITLPTPIYGTGGALSAAHSGQTNRQVLETAYPHIYAADKEIFAGVCGSEWTPGQWA